VPERLIRGSRHQSEASLNSFSQQWNFFIFDGRVTLVAVMVKRWLLFCHETEWIRAVLILISLIAL
jgi:hypothetical protein